MGKSLQFLKTTNAWLEKVPISMINAFENMIGSGEKISQSKVDQICAWLAWKVKLAIERKRQALIQTLHDQYVNNQKGPVMRAVNAITSFVSDPLGALGDFASTVFAPIAPAIEWIKILIKEIPKLVENLARIVSALPPAPPNPRINYDKFKIKVGSLSLGAIIKGTAGMKSPEEMFPEPEKPFSKESFERAFADASVALKSNSKKYVLKPDDFESMSTVIQKEAGSDLLDGITLDSLGPAVKGEIGDFDNPIIDNSIG